MKRTYEPFMGVGGKITNPLAIAAFYTCMTENFLWDHSLLGKREHVCGIEVVRLNRQMFEKCLLVGSAACREKANCFLIGEQGRTLGTVGTDETLKQACLREDAMDHFQFALVCREGRKPTPNRSLQLIFVPVSLSLSDWLTTSADEDGCADFDMQEVAWTLTLTGAMTRSEFASKYGFLVDGPGSLIPTEAICRSTEIRSVRESPLGWGILREQAVTPKRIYLYDSEGHRIAQIPTARFPGDPSVPNVIGAISVLENPEAVHYVVEVESHATSESCIDCLRVIIHKKGRRRSLANHCQGEQERWSEMFKGALRGESTSVLLRQDRGRIAQRGVQNH